MKYSDFIENNLTTILANHGIVSQAPNNTLFVVYTNMNTLNDLAIAGLTANWYSDINKIKKCSHVMVINQNQSNFLDYIIAEIRHVVWMRDAQNDYTHKTNNHLKPQEMVNLLNIKPNLLGEVPIRKIVFFDNPQHGNMGNNLNLTFPQPPIAYF